MYLLIPLLLLVIVTLFYVATKEGLEDKKELGNTMMDKKAINVDLDKNSVELPNHVSGIVSEDLDMGGNLNILNENRIELGKGNKNKGPASGTIQYKNNFLNIIGAGKDGDKSKVKLWDDVEIGSLLNVGGGATIGGPLHIANKIELGPTNKPANSGKIEYGDMLEITGVGNPKNIKLSDNVQIPGTLTTANQTGTDQTITGTQTVNNQTITGTQTVNNNQKLLAGQEVAGVSSYKGKVNINPTETDRRNMVDLSIGDELTGFRKGDKTIMFTGNTTEVGGFDAGGLFVNKPSVLEFGKGEAKQIDAGKIGYQKFSQGLDIVGAGTGGSGRKIKMWDDVEVTGKLTVNGSEIKGQGPEFSIGNVIELAKGTTKEQNAGKIIYKGHGYKENGKYQSLDIIGASPNDKTSWDKDRLIHLWDNVRVIQDLQVDRNLQVNGNITQRNQEVPTYRLDKGWGHYFNDDKPDSVFIGERGHFYTKKDGNWRYLGNIDEKATMVKGGGGYGLGGQGYEGTYLNSDKPNSIFIGDNGELHIKVNENWRYLGRLNIKDEVTTNVVKIGKWNIFEDNSGALRFSRKGIEKSQLSNTGRVDGIALGEDGNIWMSRDIYKGWMSEGIQQGINGRNTANNALSKRFVRSGRGGGGGTQNGVIQFNPPFDGDIDPGRIHVTATIRNDFGTTNKSWVAQVVVHVGQITRNNFRYSSFYMISGNNRMGAAGEEFEWIAIVT